MANSCGWRPSPQLQCCIDCVAVSNAVGSVAESGRSLHTPCNNLKCKDRGIRHDSEPGGTRAAWIRTPESYKQLECRQDLKCSQWFSALSGCCHRLIPCSAQPGPGQRPPTRFENCPSCLCSSHRLLLSSICNIVFLRKW